MMNFINEGATPPCCFVLFLDDISCSLGFFFLSRVFTLFLRLFTVERLCMAALRCLPDARV